MLSLPTPRNCFLQKQGDRMLLHNCAVHISVCIILVQDDSNASKTWPLFFDQTFFIRQEDSDPISQDAHVFYE